MHRPIKDTDNQADKIQEMVDEVDSSLSENEGTVIEAEPKEEAEIQLQKEEDRELGV